MLAPALFAGVLVLLVGLAGCGSGGGKAAVATITPARTATPSSSAQDWQQALGPGVIVTEPTTPAPGWGSPGAAVHGEANATTAAVGCSYYDPSAQAQCRKILAGVPVADLGTTTGFKLGYVAVDGNQALVGFTGTECQPGERPECVSNRDPAAIFSTAQSFATLWTESIESADSPVLSYALTPCLRVNGRWYLYFPTEQPSAA
jgi:hypothetical protein